MKKRPQRLVLATPFAFVLASALAACGGNGQGGSSSSNSVAYYERQVFTLRFISAGRV